MLSKRVSSDHRRMRTLIYALLLLPLAAQAQKKEIQMDFDNEMIEGELKAPELEIVKTLPSANHKRLVKIRQNFLKEIAQTSYSLK